MRRTVFYLLVALLTFEISSIITCLYFYDKTSNLIKTSQIQTDKYSLKIKKNRQHEFVKFKLKDLPCKDEILQIVWNELTDEIAEINTERAGKFESCEDFLEVANYLQTDKELDLNNDGAKEIFIRGIANPFSKCGNNCYTYWIFEQIGDQKYKKLFQSDGYLPVVKNKKTKGYKDIMFEFYASYNSFTNGFYQFNGTEYVLKRCWFESNLYENKDGDIVEGKKWKIESYDCKDT